MSEQLKNRLSQLSTDRLEEMLRLDSLSKSTSSENVISAVLEVLEERAAESEETAIDVDAMWKSFCEDYLPGAENGSLYLDDDEVERKCGAAPTVREKARGSKRRSLRAPARAACAVAAVIALFFSCVGIAEAAGYDAWDAVASWTEDVFADGGRCGNLIVSDPTGHEPDGTGSYPSLQDALDAYGITEPIALTWIPKEYSAEYVVATTTERGVSVFALYMSDEKAHGGETSKGITVTVSFGGTASADSQVQSGGGSKVYKSGGVEHYIANNAGNLVAAWHQDGYEAFIGGNDLSRADMKRMIRSIYE